MKETNELIGVFASIEDKEQMRLFFQEVFTPNERHDLSLRWKLMKMLKKGIPQRKIAAELGVSLCKITRGSKIIQDSRSVTNRLIQDES